MTTAAYRTSTTASPSYKSAQIDSMKRHKIPSKSWRTPMDLSMEKGQQFVEQTQSPEGAAAWKQQLDEFAPGASDWVVGAVFGGTYQREGLELRDRQMLNKIGRAHV